MGPIDTHLLQIGRAVLYYAGLLTVVRLAGKRLAGQTTTIDLLVLITLGVVLQTAALQDGTLNALIFVVTVFALHRGTAALCARSRFARNLLRGRPRPLVRDGRILEEALAAEGITPEELSAGLRKLGFAGPEDVKLAVLEETGQVSAVGRETRGRLE